MNTKTTTIIIIVIAIIALAFLGYFIFTQTSQERMERQEPEAINGIDLDFEAEEEEMTEGEEERVSVIGQSVEGRNIEAHTFGTGNNHLLFVGGIHGGYSWNTALVAFQLIEYLEENGNAIPENLKVTVIPVMNPDGLNKVVGTSGRFSASAVTASQEETVPGRFNGNNVDLNRNFDCEWQESGVWQSRTVGGGSAPFSEPESKAVRDYITANRPDAVIVWYSAVGGVFASSCHNGVSPETLEITNLYAEASGYPAYEEFDFYQITGDMVNWVAKEGIAGISVLLTNHRDTEWQKNLNGIEALFKYYSE